MITISDTFLRDFSFLRNSERHRAKDIMRLHSASILPVCISALLLVSHAGCGGGDGLDRVAVSGSVTVNGDPVPNGVVRFRPASGTEGPMANTMITNGRYEIPKDQGPVAGDYEVRVQAYTDPHQQETAAASVPAAVPADKLKPKLNSDEAVEGEEEQPSQIPQEANRTFNVTIPELSSFQQDFAL